MILRSYSTEYTNATDKETNNYCIFIFLDRLNIMTVNAWNKNTKDYYWGLYASRTMLREISRVFYGFSKLWSTHDLFVNSCLMNECVIGCRKVCATCFPLTTRWRHRCGRPWGLSRWGWPRPPPTSSSESPRSRTNPRPALHVHVLQWARITNLKK